MKILKIDGYKDGGTIEITTDNKVFCIDNRICSETKGIIFENYPRGNDSNIVPNQEEIKSEIKNALSEYNTTYDFEFDWKPRVLELLK